MKLLIFLIFVVIVKCTTITPTTISSTVNPNEGYETTAAKQNGGKTSTFPPGKATIISSTVLTTNVSGSTDIQVVPTPAAPLLNITQVNVIQTDALTVNLFPARNSIEIEIQVNLDKWIPKTLSKRASDKDKDLRLHIGFGKMEYPLIDIVSIQLLRNSTSNQKPEAQDSHWNAKLGKIELDKNQDFVLERFIRNESTSAFTIKVTRPWLTCDENDIQFSLSNLSIYWSILPVEDIAPLETSLTNDSVSNKRGETSTIRSEITSSATGSTTAFTTTKPFQGESTTPASRRLLTGNPAAASNGEASTFAPNTRQSTSSKIPLTNIFEGPFNMSSGILFKNFSYLHLKGCGKLFGVKTFSCPFHQYQSVFNLTSMEIPFFVQKVMHRDVDVVGNSNTIEKCPTGTDFSKWVSHTSGRNGKRLGTVENSAHFATISSQLIFVLKCFVIASLIN